MATDNIQHRKLTHLLEAQIYETDAKLSEVGEQRERNHRYYTMQPLGNEQPGRSRYISPDVLDVVESKKSYFRETFFSGRRVVKFQPTEGESQQLADAKTAYVERQLKRNGWYQLFRDGLHDAFVAKRCVYHVEWMDDEDVTLLDVEGATPEQIQWQVQQIPDVVGVDSSGVVQVPGGFAGQLRVLSDAGRVNIKLIQPERYYRDPQSSYPDDAAFCCYEEDLTRAELVAQGVSPDQVERMTTDHRFRREEEDNARKSHDSSWTRRRQHKRSKEQELITTYWTYAWLDLSEFFDGYPAEARLYKVRWSRGEVLEDENGEPFVSEVSEMPFFEWTQYKIAHAESGLCDADVVAQSQKSSSILKRLAIDNQQMRNASRWEAVVGAVKNPRDLLDTTIGGVIWSRTLNSVQPLGAPELSPMTQSVIEMLEQDKESRTGSSRLAKGLNQGAVSNQNADSMIERLTNSSNRRIMGECRDYAESLLIPLMRHIYRLGVRSDTKIYQIEVAGNQMQAQPQQWHEPAPECEVAVALTPDEGAQHAMQLMQMHQVMSQDPMLGQLYGMEQRHAMFDQIFDSLGIMDASRFLMRPGSPEHMQMLQQQQQEMEMQKQQAAQLQQFQMAMMQSADQREWHRARTEEARKIYIDGANISQDNARADEELAHKRIIDFMKYGSEERAREAKQAAA